MAGQAGGLTFCLDHNFSLEMLKALRAAWVEPRDRITHLAEQGIAGETPDEEWMVTLQQRGQHAAITRDGAILQAAIRRTAWRASGIMLLVLDSKWAVLRRPDLARGLIY